MQTRLKCHVIWVFAVSQSTIFWGFQSIEGKLKFTLGGSSFYSNIDIYIILWSICETGSNTCADPEGGQAVWTPLKNHKKYWVP